MHHNCIEYLSNAEDRAAQAVAVRRELMPIPSLLSNAGRVAAIIVAALLAGSMFAVWRGYDFASYTPATYLEVHKLAVTGLNALLPVMGLVTIALVIALAVGARYDPRRMACYIVAAVLLASAGLVTILANQPINAMVMSWTTLPEGWEQVRDTWRNWHLVRFALTMVGLVLLVVTALNDKRV
jgi:hypothetical protein